LKEVWIEKGKENEFKEEMLKKYPDKWYQCAECGGIWMKEWSDEDCAEEYKENFPNDPNREFPIAVICDDCYKKLKPWMDELTPEEREEIEKDNVIEIEFGEELAKLTEKFAKQVRRKDFLYGWKEDPQQLFHNYIYYFQFGKKQVSFHSGKLILGCQEFQGEWIGHRNETFPFKINVI